MRVHLACPSGWGQGRGWALEVSTVGGCPPGVLGADWGVCWDRLVTERVVSV